MELQDRILGAFLGLACGDALGAPAEFLTQDALQSRWGRLTEMVGGGPWLPGEWTDDTGMALCIAEGILANPGDPVPETGKRFLRWRETAKDVGSTISAVLSAYRGSWPQAAQGIPQVRAGKAAGNGSLMRTLPVALAYPDRAQMLRQGARLSSMTHWDPQAEVCCALYGLWIGGILRGKSLDGAWKDALDLARQHAIRTASTTETSGCSPLPNGFWDRLTNIPTLTYQQLQPSGYAGYVVECLEAAVWCCLHAESLEDALVRAVNLAGEADTIAAVAGGAAGAWWGVGGIPPRWLAQLYQRERLEQVAHSLHSFRRHHDMYRKPGLPPFTFHQVTERLFAGRNPLSAYDVQRLRGLGITHILDLRQQREWTDPGRYGTEALGALVGAGMTRLHLPVIDRQAPSPEVLSAAVDFLEQALAQPDSRVYVHCRAGRERTAAIILAHACRVEGLAPDRALSALQRRCPDLVPLPDQLQSVRKWVALNPSAPTATATRLTSCFEEALAFAAQIHATQFRKGTTIPYVSHLLAVASIVLEHGGTEDEAIAALLHDAIEDQGGDQMRQTIRRKFGETVVEIVDGCTDAETVPKPPWRSRKEAYIAHIQSAPASVLLVSAADKLHNARSILTDFRTHGDALWERFTGRKSGTLWYYRALIDAFRRAPAGVRAKPLIDELDRTVRELEGLCAAE